MLKKLQHPLFTYISSILVCILFILYIFSTLNVEAMNIYFNSDCLYLPSIYKDLFVEHNSIQDWYLSPAPGFFPDMFFYFILKAIFKNFIVVSFLYALFQFNVLLLLIRKLFKIVDNTISFTYISIANLCMTLFFMVTTISNDFTFTFYLLNNAFHFGSFIMCLLCLIYSFSYLKNNSPRNIKLLLLFGIIAVASDRLFIVLYSLPMLGVCLAMLNKENWHQLKKLLLANIGIVIGGLLCFALIKNSGVVFIGNPHKLMEYSNMHESFNMLISQFKIYLTEGSVKTIIVFLNIISFLVMLFISIKSLYVYRAAKTEKNIASWLVPAYLLFSVFFMLIVFWAPVINGNYTGFDTIRYNIYALYLGTFNWGIILFYFFNDSKIIIILTSMVCLFAVGSLLYMYSKDNVTKGLKEFVNYYPKEVEQIDSIATAHNLKYGIAGYWDAKFITMFSKKDLRVYAVYNQMTPFYHATNSNWFYDKDFGQHQKPVFNFVVVDNISDLSYFNEVFGDTTQIIKTNFIEVRKVFDFKFDRATYLPTKR